MGKWKKLNMSSPTLLKMSNGIILWDIMEFRDLTHRGLVTPYGDMDLG